MPDKQYSSNSYRYGFNGKESDNEVKGTGCQYDYGFRIYDPRIARFLSVDPLTSEYPFYSPFQFAGNSPIRNIDVDGLEDKSAIDPPKQSPSINPTNVELVAEGIKKHQAQKDISRQVARELTLLIDEKIQDSYIVEQLIDVQLSWETITTSVPGPNVNSPSAVKTQTEVSSVHWSLKSPTQHKDATGNESSIDVIQTGYDIVTTASDIFEVIGERSFFPLLMITTEIGPETPINSSFDAKQKEIQEKYARIRGKLRDLYNKQNGLEIVDEKINDIKKSEEKKSNVSSTGN